MDPHRNIANRRHITAWFTALASPLPQEAQRWLAVAGPRWVLLHYPSVPLRRKIRGAAVDWWAGHLRLEPEAVPVQAMDWLDRGDDLWWSLFLDPVEGATGEFEDLAAWLGRRPADFRFEHLTVPVAFHQREPERLTACE